MADTKKTHEQLEQEWNDRMASLAQAGGKARRSRQAKLGRMSAHGRIAALVDADSFSELGKHAEHRSTVDALVAQRYPGDGVVCGLATIEGRRVAVYAHEPSVLRGALGATGARKLCRLLDLAHQDVLPVIAIADSDGARVAEGTDAVMGYGEVMAKTIRLKGRVPQLTLAAGLCVGAAAYTAALTDFVAMVEGVSFMFITGPKVTEITTGEIVDIDALGGSKLHSEQTGSCHAIVENERAGIEWLRRMLASLTPITPTTDPVTRPTPELAAIVPTEPRRAYNVKKVIQALFDSDSFLEISKGFAANLVTGFARLGGRSVAVIASQPMVKAGCLDILSSRKGAAFIRFANKNQLPIITLVDVPGYIPGLQQEAGGALVFGAELLSAYGEAQVPMLCLVLRKSYGGANVLSFSATVRLGLPMAQVAPMGAQATKDVTLGKLPDAPTPEDVQRHSAFLATWEERYMDAWRPAADGYLDRVVLPHQSRHELFITLQSLDRRGTKA